MAAEPATPAKRRRLRSFALAAAALFGGVGLILWSLPPAPMARYAETAAQITDREGRLLRSFLSEDDAWRFHAERADVDPLYLRMLFAFEDQRFERHVGVDPLAVLRAVGQLARYGDAVSGASTITMQAARLLDPGPRSIGRKVLEAARAVGLERRLGKDGALSVYLTLAPFGGNLEGVVAGAWGWFGKPPALLTPAEAALLVALPKNPNGYRPDLHPAAAARARARVLAQAVARGVITAEEAAAANAAPLPRARLDFPMIAPHASERAYAQTGARLTLDAGLQQKAEAALRAGLSRIGRDVTGAALVVDRFDMGYRAYVGGPDYFDLRRAGMNDMARAVRSPGSALKPFIYGLAFDRAIAHPDTLIDDRAADFAGYAPSNFDDGFSGQTTIAQALRRSLNIPAVAVLARLGPAEFDAALQGVGVTLAFDRARDAATLPIALGGAGIDLEDLARLGVAMAGDGTVPAALRLRESDPEPQMRRLFGPAAAWRLRMALSSQPAPGGLVSEAAAATEGAMRLPYKTGTSWGYRDALSVGVWGRYVIAVWVGRPDGSPCAGCIGARAAAPILFDIARALPTPGPGDWAARPDSLPPGDPAPRALRRFEGGGGGFAGTAPDLNIVFPPDGSKLAAAAGSAAPLKAEGGKRPLRWRVNGRFLPANGPGLAARWRPDGGGFHRIEVIDAAGAAQAVTVWVER